MQRPARPFPLALRIECVGDGECTRTRQGLRIRAALDANAYPTGIKISDAELAAVRQIPAPFHGEWNYTILSTDWSVDTFISWRALGCLRC